MNVPEGYYGMNYNWLSFYSDCNCLEYSTVCIIYTVSIYPFITFAITIERSYKPQGQIFIIFKGGVEKFVVGCNRHH
jgi:hypothetical protein